MGGDQAPFSTLPGGFLLAWALFPWCRPLPANVKGLGVEKLNPSRRARCLPPSRRFKSQGLGVAPTGAYLLKVRSFPAHVPNVVAMHSGKQSHSEDNADSGVQFIILEGPKQSLLLAKDPDQHLWKSFVPHMYVSEPTTPNSFRLT